MTTQPVKTNPNTVYVDTVVPPLSLVTLQGNAVPLAELWQKEPVLLFFLRHSGCALCRSHLRVLRDALPRFREHGVSLAAITFADAASASQMQHRQEIHFPIFLDNSYRVYNAFGMFNGRVSDAITPHIIVEQLRQIAKGHVPYIAPGANLTQLGGSVLVDTNGMIRFHHVAHPIDRYPTVEQYLSAMQAL